jgi:hypothetical protein
VRRAAHLAKRSEAGNHSPPPQGDPSGRDQGTPTGTDPGETPSVREFVERRLDGRLNCTTDYAKQGASEGEDRPRRGRTLAELEGEAAPVVAELHQCPLATHVLVAAGTASDSDVLGGRGGGQPLKGDLPARQPDGPRAVDQTLADIHDRAGAALVADPLARGKEQSWKTV